MAKFVYRMQNILNIKQKLENQEKINYGIASAKLQEEQMKLQDLLVQRAGYENELKDSMTGNIDLQQINSLRTAINTMKSLVRTQMLAVNAAQNNLEIARRKLKAVMIERKTHEKLRERAFEEFKKELAYEENKAVDELVSYTYHSIEE